ncbi:protein-export chaperone SecB [Levilactobacillus andaensis]|uniref:protein-export chaperone SecB n=1 Tax=Levilactobacillus andaensis TaxID=2799570 RepID=UPI001941820D|nr:protein-export chaperone SecB [Levilactobacillus andaensis]
MTENIGPVIRLSGYRIFNLEYNSYSSQEFKDKMAKDDMQNIKIASSMSFEKRIGQIKLTTSFFNQENNQIGTITVLGQFRINDAVTDEEKAKNYILQNGSAMIYPYVRAMVSMITALDKPDVTVMPTMNFSEAFGDN